MHPGTNHRFLREAEVALAQGRRIGQVCKALGVSELSYYRWRKVYGGLKIDRARQFLEYRLWLGGPDLAMGGAESSPKATQPGPSVAQ